MLYILSISNWLLAIRALTANAKILFAVADPAARVCGIIDEFIFERR